MPPVKQPGTLQDIALQVTATCIRASCDDVILEHGDVTQQATKQHLESLNEQLVRNVPLTLLHRLRKLQNLAGFVYFEATELQIEQETLVNSPMHRHLVSNVIPRLTNVTTLDLTNVEGSLDLFTAVRDYCRELKNIFLNTKLSTQQCDPSYDKQCSQHWEYWLLLLTNCKKLEVIKDVSTLGVVFFHISNETKAHLLRDLPVLKELHCNGIPMRLLFPPPEDAGTYSLTRINIGIDCFSDGYRIRWLNKHCPFLKHVDFFTVQDSQRVNEIFQELSESDVKIESLNFPYRPPKFTEAMDMYFVKKGYLLDTLVLDYSQGSFCESISENALSCDDVIVLFFFCPALKRLSLLGNWYNGQQVTVQQIKKMTFPNLIYFKFVYYNTTVIMPVLLEELIHVNTLYCFVRTSAFFDTFESLRNGFISLIDIDLELCLFNFGPGNILPFLKRFFPVVMKWPNIRNVQLDSFEEGRLPLEAIQFLEMLRHQIKEQNLDLTIAFEDSYKG